MAEGQLGDKPYKLENNFEIILSFSWGAIYVFLIKHYQRFKIRILISVIYIIFISTYLLVNH